MCSTSCASRQWILKPLIDVSDLQGVSIERSLDSASLPSNLMATSTSSNPASSSSPQPSTSSASYPSPASPMSTVASSTPSLVPTVIPEEDVATVSDMMDTSDTPGTESSEGSEKTSASRPYPCLVPDCGRWFKRTYTRNVHMLTHSRTKERKPFPCTVSGCVERFSRKHDRLRHEVGQHGRGSNWSCPVCPRFFSSQVTLERHVSEKHND